MNTYDKQHLSNIDYYMNEINNLYDTMIADIAAMATGVYISGAFSFDRFPSLRKRVEKRLSDGGKKIIITIQNGIRDSWDISNRKNDALVAGLIKNPPKVYTQRNLEALKAFQTRKVKGLRVSDRVWNIQGAFKTQLEQAIQTAITEGMSAQTLSREIRGLLNNPDSLYRRIRRNGNLVTSKKALSYHPGQGVYRSSYKNALRLAGHEINKAYREADWIRWRQLDFVVGFDITTTRSKGVCPLCGLLAGRYPKEFKFTGWHISCRCICTPVIVSVTHFDKLTEKPKNGEKSKYAQPPMPKNFTKWFGENRGSAERSLPDWFTDNLHLF